MSCESEPTRYWLLTICFFKSRRHDDTEIHGALTTTRYWLLTTRFFEPRRPKHEAHKDFTQSPPRSHLVNVVPSVSALWFFAGKVVRRRIFLNHENSETRRYTERSQLLASTYSLLAFLNLPICVIRGKTLSANTRSRRDHMFIAMF